MNTFFSLKNRTSTFCARALAALLAVLFLSSAHAAVVNSTVDPTEGGKTTLRDAINAANTSGGTITFDNTVFTAASPKTIILFSTLPALNNNITITGPGADAVTISGASTYRILIVNSGKTVSISGVTFANGMVTGTAGNNGAGATLPTNGGNTQGGGILNSGSLSLTLCALNNNIAMGGSGGAGASATTQTGAIGGNAFGGGIFCDATATALTISRCTFSNNTARGGNGGHGADIINPGNSSGVGGLGGNGFGGGIYVTAGTCTITNSTLAANIANGGTGGMGGLANFADGGTNAGGTGGNGEGGAIYTAQSATITSCTVGLNNANPGKCGERYATGPVDPDGTSAGGGIRATGAATITVGNSIIASNTSNEPKTSVVTESDVIGGTFSSANFNLIGGPDATVTTFTGTADQKGTVAAPLNPKFDTLGLQNNGGTLMTLKLRKGSPAIDKGHNVTGGIDEIGNPRPVDLSDAVYPQAPGGDASDIGALEAQVLANAPPTTYDQSASGVVGTAFSGVQLAANDTDGDTLKFIIVSGTMPAGLTLNSDGSITGTPTATTTSSGTIVMFKVNDGLADSTTQKLTATISEKQSSIVTSTADVYDQYDGVTTLREAINFAAGNGGIVTFDSTVFASAKTITLLQSNGAVGLGSNIEIDGSTAGVTLVGNNSFALFSIGGGTVKFRDLTLAQGAPAINSTNFGSPPTITLTNCTLRNNGANDFQGGAVANNGGTVTLLNCTLANNSANFTSNANVGGGAVFMGSGTTTVQNCTITLNQSTGGKGGGIYITGGTLNLGNSIVAGNTASTGPDINGTVTSQGYNIFSSTSGATINGTLTGNQTTATPGLDPAGLASNGGPTQTIKLMTGSVAIDQGKTLGGVTTDQRGLVRPSDDTNIPNAAGGDGADIGAYEVQVAAVPAPKIVVEQPAGTGKANGSTIPYGNVQIQTTQDLIFTIRNTGTLNLNLTGTPKVAVSGTDMSLFTVTAQPTSPVASAGSTTFTVRFAPLTTGAKSASLSIANDDSNNNPFTLNLTGTGIDTITQPPTLTAPASNTTVGNPITVTLTLPEAAKAGTVKLTFDNGLSQKVLVLNSAQESAGTHSFTFNPANPTAAPTGIASGPAIPDGTYSVQLTYQDSLANPVGFTQNGNVKIDTSTIAPTITGTMANQPVNDNATILPFANVTIADANVPTPTQNVTFKLSNTAYGSITNPNGFNDAGGGTFTYFGTTTAVTAALQGVVFTPANNQLPVGQTQVESFTITANNGIAPTVTNSTTSVVITSVNDAPMVTIGGAPASVAPGTAVNLTSTVVDPDVGDTAAYAWAVTKNGTAFGSATTATFSFAPDAPGTYVVTLTVTDKSNATGNATATVTATNPPVLTFDSAPTATPNPAAIGQTVNCIASATSSSPVTWTWSFGDGASGGAASVSHAYSAAGTFQVTVVATNAEGLTITATISVVVNAAVFGTGPDSDGDGFSDAAEILAGSDPANPASTPTGKPITAAGTIALTVSKIGIKLNFAKPKSDSLTFSGVLALPTGFVVKNQKVLIDAGGIERVFTLNDKGAAKAGDDSFKLSVKSRKGAVSAQNAKYMLTIKKADLAAALADEGLTGDANVKNAPKTIIVEMAFNGDVLVKTQALTYTATKNKQGTAVQPK